MDVLVVVVLVVLVVVLVVILLIVMVMVCGISGCSVDDSGIGVASGDFTLFVGAMKIYQYTDG